MGKKKKILPHAKCKSKRQSSSEECLPLSPQRIPLANTEKGQPTRQKRKMGTDMTRERSNGFSTYEKMLKSQLLIREMQIKAGLRDLKNC